MATPMFHFSFSFMKIGIFIFLVFFDCSAFADTPDVYIPAHEIELIKTADYVEVSGTNDLGGAENFSIHNAKAIAQFVGLLTSDRFTAVPRSLKPRFKSLSFYRIRLSSKGSALLQVRMIGDSILDLPGETSFYMESDRYSENLMAPLLRLR